MAAVPKAILPDVAIPVSNTVQWLRVRCAAQDLGGGVCEARAPGAAARGAGELAGGGAPAAGGAGAAAAHARGAAGGGRGAAGGREAAGRPAPQGGQLTAPQARRADARVVNLGVATIFQGGRE